MFQDIFCKILILISYVSLYQVSSVDLSFVWTFLQNFNPIDQDSSFFIKFRKIKNSVELIDWIDGGGLKFQTVKF